MKLLQWFYKWKHKGGLDIEMTKKDAQNNFVLGWGFGGDYKPKNVRTNNADKIMEVIDQQGLNICVCVSGTNGKQCDEQVLLDYQFATAYLTSLGKMNSNGTSLTAYQDMLRKVGIPRRSGVINNSLSFTTFSDRKILNQARLENASAYKIQSYFQTYELNKVLEELDNGRTGHAGSTWYTGYNSGGLNNLGIATPYSGYKVGGHATLIVDYDTDYYGYKVLKCLNSYSTAYGKGGYFYVKFEDFNKIFDFGVIFNSDLPKDIIGWLSQNAGNIVQEANGPKIYVIEADRKRHIPDEAMLQMVMVANAKPNWVRDTENMLAEVKEGQPITFAEIPAWAAETVKQMAKWSSNPTWVNETFKKYFDLTN